MNNSENNENFTIVGNPFANIGRGGVVLNLFYALEEVFYNPAICDVSSRFYNKPDPIIEQKLAGFMANNPSLTGINLFVINIDEINITRDHLGDYPSGAYNIIYPAWELSHCPPEWEQELEVFDEIWAPSQFVLSAFQEISKKPLYYLPHPIEPKFSYFLNRNYFGLSDSSYIFLFFFDFRSYLDRKNPFAVIDAFEKTCARMPFVDTQLVLKVSGMISSPKINSDLMRFNDRINSSPYKRKIKVLSNNYNENEIKNLIRCCDCFVSLHRSEGFGLGLAEAMYLEKPVIATNYSGNQDFMTSENSYLVDYKLIPVLQGEYPNHENQLWAEPDIDQASKYMLELIDCPEKGAIVGKKASKDIRLNLSYLKVGFQAKARVKEIISMLKISVRS